MRLQPLPVCADNALAAAVDAGVVAELAASIAGGTHFDPIALLAFQTFMGRWDGVRDGQACMCQQGTAGNGYQSHESDTDCFHCRGFLLAGLAGCGLERMYDSASFRDRCPLSAYRNDNLQKDLPKGKVTGGHTLQQIQSGFIAQLLEQFGDITLHTRHMDILYIVLE